jgi:PAS domain S-box-containing protein
LDAKLFWNHAEYLVGMPVVPLTVLLALRVTGWERRLPAWAAALLFGVPALAVALNWTWRWHGLLYARVWLEAEGGLTFLTKARGPLYAPVFAYAYALMLAACVIFAVRCLRHRSVTVSQAVLVGLAVVAPLVFGAPYYWLPLPALRRLNTLHAGYFVTTLLFSAVLLRGRFLNLVRALGEAQERSELLLAHANAIFYTIRPDGRFAYVSDSWQTFLGHRAEEMVGREYREVVLAEDVPACDAFLEEVVRSGELRAGIEYRLRHQDGSVRWHTSSIKPVLDAAGRPVTFVGVAHDITAVKRTQEELGAANERLRRLIASREAELRAAVAGALTASEGEARRIGREIHDGLCQELVGLLRMAESEVQRTAGSESKERAQALVQQAAHALGLARSASYDLTLHDLEAMSLYEALAVFARRFARASNVEIEINCSAERCTFAPPAAEHIYRFVREAVVNALRHGRADRIWIDVVHESGQTVLSVTNDGLPLPPDEQLSPGLGLTQMRMRASQLGGAFSLSRDAQNKTVAELTVPYGSGSVSYELHE